MWLFYLTIIFAVVYHGLLPRARAPATCMAAEYEKEMKAGDAIKAARHGASSRPTSPRSQPSKDPAVLAHGQADLHARCARRAIAPDGGGLVGPNLSDDYWIHGCNFVGQREDHLERRAGQGHDHLEELRSSRTRSRTWPATSTPCAARIRRIPSRRRTRRPAKTGPERV